MMVLRLLGVLYLSTFLVIALLHVAIISPDDCNIPNQNGNGNDDHSGNSSHRTTNGVTVISALSSFVVTITKKNDEKNSKSKKTNTEVTIPKTALRSRGVQETDYQASTTTTATMANTTVVAAATMNSTDRAAAAATTNTTTNKNSSSSLLSPLPRVALFMPTHASKDHLRFIEQCWPAAIQRFKFLQEADLIVHLPKQLPSSKFKNAISRLAFRRIIIHEDNNAKTGYQQGAMWPMVVAFQENYFAGYDWVFRLNPDVLILDDTFLSKVIRLPDAQVVTVYCSETDTGFIHSDFSGFRPALIPPNRPAEIYYNNATKNWVAEYLHSWLLRNFTAYEIPNSRHGSGLCRVRGPLSAVQHDHRLINFCPNYFDHFKHFKVDKNMSLSPVIQHRDW